MPRLKAIHALLLGLIVTSGSINTANADDPQANTDSYISNVPLSVPSLNVPTLAVLAVGRDHNLMVEAYSDYTDLDGDDVIDTKFMPSFVYTGLFDSNLCYKYDSSHTVLGEKEGIWRPESRASDMKCPASEWSGNFLNYVTASRLDVIRKVLYGGGRANSGDKNKIENWGKDGSGVVLLKHSHVTPDAHAWGKVLDSDISSYAGTSCDSDQALFLGVASEDNKGNTSGFLRYKCDSKDKGIWNFVSQEASDGTNFSELGNGTSIIVAACDKNFITDDSCKNYGTESNPQWRPVGILQEYGDTDSMRFGLVTGSWDNNITKNSTGGDIKSEITTSSLNTIMTTLDAFKIKEKDDGTVNEYGDCKRAGKNNLLNPDETVGTGGYSKCSDWGNPVSKVLQAAVDMADRGDTSTPSAPLCSSKIVLLLADETVTFDAGKYNGYNDTDTSLGDLPASMKGKKYLVGFSKSDQAYENTSKNLYKYLPSTKVVNSLDDIVGLAPNAAFAYGGYKVAGVAKNSNIDTYVVAMKPNMPEIKIPIGHANSGQYVTIVPFAVTPSYDLSGFRSINQAVDFYVESLGENEGTFRVNYEDFQFGSDYDMDWVVKYHYKVYNTPDQGSYVRIEVANEVSDHYANQHAGYIITGVTHPGVYVDLEKPEITKGSNNNPQNEVGGNGVEHPEKYHMPIDTMISDLTIRLCNDKGLGNNLVECLANGGYENYAKQGGKKLDDVIKNIDGDIVEHYKLITKNPTVTAQYYGNKYNLAKNNGLSCKDYFTKLPNDFTNVPGFGGNPVCKNISYRNYGHHWRVSGDAWKDGVTKTSRTFKIDATQADNVYLKSPLWFAAHYGLKTNGSFTGNNMKDPSNYFYATDPTKLKKGLKSLLIRAGTISVHSTSSFSTKTSSTSTGDAVYGTQFEASEWWGDVLKSKVGKLGGYNNAPKEFPEDSDGMIQSSLDTKNADWSAKEAFETLATAKGADARLIVTYDRFTDNKLKRVYASEQSAETLEDANAIDNAYNNLGKGVFSLLSHGTSGLNFS